MRGSGMASGGGAAPCEHADAASATPRSPNVSLRAIAPPSTPLALLVFLLHRPGKQRTDAPSGNGLDRSRRRRERGERGCLALDVAPLGETLEPQGGERARAVAGAEQRGGHRGVRVVCVGTRD